MKKKENSFFYLSVKHAEHRLDVKYNPKGERGKQFALGP